MAQDVDSDVFAVVEGFDNKFTYKKLTQASLYLQKNNAKLICTNRDRNSSDGERLQPASASLRSFLMTAAGLGEDEAPVIGKPSKVGFEMLKNEHSLEHINPMNFLMVGDNLNSDIEFANNTAIDSLLVLTGVTTKEKAFKLEESDAKPTHIQPCLGFGLD